MAIIVPQQEEVTLGRSRITPRETYAGAPVQRGGGGGADDLINALSSFSNSVLSFANKNADAQDKADMRNIEYTANSIRQSIREGEPYEAQIGNLLPEKSAAVRARVAENLGFDRGRAWVDSKYKEMFSDPAMLTDPTEVERRMGMIRSEAAAQVKGQPSYGQGFLQAVEGHLGQFAQQSTAQRNALFQEEQLKGYGRDIANRSSAAYNGSNLLWRTVGGEAGKFTHLRGALTSDKSVEHINNLKHDFGSRLDQMIAAAPPEIQQSLKIGSGYRSNERQAEIFADAVAKHGSEAAARKWAAPPGRSNHNYGEAVDLAFASPAARKWAHDNAERFGLYFPMKHESWHIEMRGGRREGDKGHRNMMAEADGEDTTGSPIQTVVRKIAGVESGGDPTAQNARSSAGGIGQFIDSTWLQYVRNADPKGTTGKSDAELVRWKTDPAKAGLQQQVLTMFTEANAERLTRMGQPVTEANLYLMHFAGQDGGPKIIKASEGTRIEDVLKPDAINANPFLRGMTVGEVREWASGKMGSATSGVASARNAIRATDREYAQSSSLPDVVRRKAIVSHLTEMAVKTADPSYLDRMPPELITPEVAAEFLQVKRQVAALQHQEIQRARQARKQAEDDQYDEMQKDIVMKSSRGEQIDPRLYAKNPKAFEYAVKMQGVEFNLSPLESNTNKSLLMASIEEASLSGDWSKISPDFAGRTPKTAEILRAVRDRNDLLSSDKIAIQNGLPKLMESLTIAASPEVKRYFNDMLGADLKAFASNQSYQDLLKLKNINLQGEVQKTFETTVRAMVKAYVETNGQQPVGMEMFGIMEKAEVKARTRFKELMETAAGPKAGQAAEQKNNAASSTPPVIKDLIFDPATKKMQPVAPDAKPKAAPASKPVELKITIPPNAFDAMGNPTGH